MLLQTKLNFDHLQKLENKAKELLEKFKNWQHKYVFFSGGKDSLVALDLANKHLNDFMVIYVEITGNTHPKCTKYVRRVLENYYGVDYMILRKDADFYDYLEKYGYPSVIWKRARWCMGQFKEKVVRAYTKGCGVGIAGISPADSPRRKYKAKPIWMNGWVSVNISPLFWFTKEDIWLYIHENGLEINPLYDEIGYSGNCMLCPAMTNIQFERFAKTEFFEKWKRVHKLLREKEKMGRLRGMKCVFRWFDERYRVYCKKLEEVDSE